MRVYLAGKMAGLTHSEMSEWRTKAKLLLEDHGFEVLNPVLSSIDEDSSGKEIVANNKAMIRKSDIILAEFDHKDPSFGTIGEVVFSSELQIPVVSWGLHPIRSPWIQEHVVRHFCGLEEAVAYLIGSYCF